MAKSDRTDGPRTLEQWRALQALSGESRRGFRQLAATLGLALWVSPEGAARLVFADEEEITGPRDPDLTGVLRSAEVRDLWTIFAYIGATWDNAELSTRDSRRDLERVLDLKTGRAPSYLTEYREAVRIFRALRSQLGEQEALRRIFFETPDPRLRQFVVLEFLRLQVAAGGFARFGGYRNYPGFPGGPFDDRAHLPYRPATRPMPS